MFCKINNFVFFTLVEKKLVLIDFRNGNTVYGDENAYYFLSILTESPLSIDELAVKLSRLYTKNFDFENAKHDLTTFYNSLANQEYVSIGNTHDECQKNSIYFSYDKKNLNLENYRKKEYERLEEINDGKIFQGHPLQSILIEITQKCNERCVQCYIPHSQKNIEMKDSDFYRIIDEACSIPTVSSIRLSGGECMSHPSFKSFIKYVKSKKLALTILTNLTLLDDEIIAILAEGKLSNIQVSLFSLDENVQDLITGLKGSLTKVKENLNKLHEANIPVSITCQYLEYNKDSIGNLMDFCNENKFDFHFDFNIIPRQDLSTDNLKYAIQDSNLYSSLCETCILKKQGYLEKSLEKIKKPLRKPDSKVCSAGYGTCVIHTDLTVGPCPGWLIDCGNLTNQKILDVWNNSEKLNAIRNIYLKNFPKCANCSVRNICYICPSQIYNESGDFKLDFFDMPNRICEMYKSIYKTLLEHDK
ncbi:MAG: radical SAM protein [Treponema sp.]|nr:radical SAM protein [Treponema sp.]